MHDQLTTHLLESMHFFLHYNTCPHQAGKFLGRRFAYFGENVIPQDVKSVAMDVMRHRVIITYEAEAEEKTSEDIIEQILQTVEVP